MDIAFSEKSGKLGHLGIVTLNRPQALNALTLDMCLAFDKQLEQWERQTTIKGVVVCGAGERAFCAGGDIVSLYHSGIAGDHAPLQKFFYHEYRLNSRIYHYSKPYIAFMDGVTMGGGAGISIHGSHRVATERLVFAMPETAIGFFPDIGATYFLPRCPGEMGRYLGLTGARLNAADAAYLGLTDVTVPSEKIEEIISALAEVADGSEASITRVLQDFSKKSESSELALWQSQVDQCFGHDEMQLITQQLMKQDTTWANSALDQLASKSPTSLLLTLEVLRRGKHLTFDCCMDMELQFAQYFIHSQDFYEGIRAVVIDKDQQPKWSPPIERQGIASLFRDFPVI